MLYAYGMKGYLATIGLIILAVIVGLSVMTVRGPKSPPGAPVCPQDTKMCPDGSQVGRSGFSCEFSKCAESSPVSLEARIGQEVSGLGVRITPLEILEDSRCPADVMCIQAGTVRVSTRLISGLGEAKQEFRLGQPITTEAEEITLIKVSPEPKAGVKINDSDYVLQFEVTKR